MLRFKIAFLAMLLMLCSLAAFADSPMMGTWKLNEAKSKFGPGETKNHTVSYTDAGNGMTKVTVDGTTPDGKSAHNEWTGKFDGKDYPVTGDSPAYDSRAYTVTNAKTMRMTLKKDGKTVGTGDIVVSADGKSRTVTTHVTNAAGKKVSSTAVYDKQ